MLLAEYGGAEWADQQAQLQLTMSYVRRKRFEARLIAVEVGALFAGGAQGGEKRVAGHELLAMAGITL